MSQDLLEKQLGALTCLAALLGPAAADSTTLPAILETTTIEAGDSLTWANDLQINQAPQITIGPNAVLRLTGAISNVAGADAGLFKSGQGILILEGMNTYSGNTVVQQGTLRVTGTQAAGSSFRTVDMHAGTQLDYADGAILHNAIRLHPAAGAAAANAWDTPEQAVKLRVDHGSALQAGSVVGNVLMIKLGAGTLRLERMATTPSLAVVHAGALEVNSLFGGPVHVQNTASLAGTGAVGSATLYSGGSLSPGAVAAAPGTTNALGELTVTGNLHMNADSALIVDALPDGRADHVRVLGQATLNGKVATRITEGPWQPETRYTLVSADGGLQGSFASATASLPFMQPHLSYDTTHAYLTLKRNDTPLDSVIDEPSHNDIGDAVDALTDHTTAPVRNAVITQNSNDARDLLNVLSGKWAPSVFTRLIEDSRYLRETALNQLNASYPTAPPVWASSYIARARRTGKGQTPADQRLLRGFALGGTFVVSPRVRATVFAGYEHSTLSQTNANALTTVGTLNLGAAAATRHGLIDLSLGLIRSWHRLSGQREIIGRRLQQWLSSKYRMQALQVFGEAALPLFETTPTKAGSAQHTTYMAAFNQLAWVHLHSPQHREHGGSAALAFKDSRGRTLFSRFGLRAHHEWQDNTHTYRVGGEVAWQHATGDVAPSQQAYFSHASDKRLFETSSQGIARNALDIKFGLTTIGRRGTRLAFGYNGRLAQGGTDHGAGLDVSWTF